MSADILPFAPLPPKEDRKARFRARREGLGLAKRKQDDLAMDHADPEMPCDSNPQNLA